MLQYYNSKVKINTKFKLPEILHLHVLDMLIDFKLFTVYAILYY